MTQADDLEMKYWATDYKQQMAALILGATCEFSNVLLKNSNY